MSLAAGVALLVALEATAGAPAIAAAPKAEILGRWKGTSTCTKVPNNEFCRDETVVYEFIDVPGQEATVALKASRVVDGTVQPMYSLYFTYRPDQGRWTSEFTRPQFRGVWEYVVHGDEIKGTATVLPDMTVVRNVAVSRVPKEQAP